MSAQDPSGSWQEGFENIDLRYIVDTRASLKVQLENPGQEAICFKIKTSNPDRYAVVPSVGVVAPGETADIAILGAAMDAESCVLANYAVDRFQVQVGAADCDADATEFWKNPPVRAPQHPPALL
jgi:hypothetical protein